MLSLQQMKDANVQPWRKAGGEAAKLCLSLVCASGSCWSHEQHRHSGPCAATAGSAFVSVQAQVGEQNVQNPDFHICTAPAALGLHPAIAFHMKCHHLHPPSAAALQEPRCQTPQSQGMTASQEWPSPCSPEGTVPALCNRV